MKAVTTGDPLCARKSPATVSTWRRAARFAHSKPCAMTCKLVRRLIMTDPDPGQLRGIKVLVLFGGSHLFGQERANIEVMRTIREAGAKVHFITDKRHAGGE